MVKTKTKIHWLEMDGKKRPLWELKPIEIHGIHNGAVWIRRCQYNQSLNGAVLKLQTVIADASPYQSGDIIPGPDYCKWWEGICYQHYTFIGHLCKCLDGKAPHKLTQVRLVEAGQISLNLEDTVETLRFHRFIEHDLDAYLCLGDTAECT